MIKNVIQQAKNIIEVMFTANSNEELNKLYAEVNKRTAEGLQKMKESGVWTDAEIEEVSSYIHDKTDAVLRNQAQIITNRIRQEWEF